MWIDPTTYYNHMIVHLLGLVFYYILCFKRSLIKCIKNICIDWVLTHGPTLLFRDITSCVLAVYYIEVLKFLKDIIAIHFPSVSRTVLPVVINSTSFCRKEYLSFLLVVNNINNNILDNYTRKYLVICFKRLFIRGRGKIIYVF